MGDRDNSKKKKKTCSKNYFISITSLSFAGALVVWAGAAAEDSGPLPLRSSLVGTGRVAKTISILWEASFSLGKSLGAVGGLVAAIAAEGLVASGATLLVVFVSFSATPGCSASLEGLSGERRALVGLSLSVSTSSEAVPTLEPEELDARMTGGYYTLSALLKAEEASTSA